MKYIERGVFRCSRLALVTCLFGCLLSLVVAPVRADTHPRDPSDPTTPRTASANPLPTTQINGVVWAQEVIGNTVYVAGEFTRARPAGAAPGVNEVPRSNLLAYDIRTGVLSTTWMPSTNAEVTDIEASPDKSRLYIAGNFTTVNGRTQRRIAALNPTNGNRIAAFSPNPNGRVRSVVATDTTVYFGGYFGTVSGVTRSRFAAARASDGALREWAPSASDGYAWDMALSPDNSQVLAVGSFTSVNGSTEPGLGMASIDAVSGALRPWAANSLIRNSGAQSSAITSVESAGGYVYASGATFSRFSNLEGVVKMDWNGGDIAWVEDCHGDSLDTYLSGDVMYVASHAHYCGNLPNGFPQTETPWKTYRGTAFTTATTGVLRTEYLNYFNFAGQPAPSLLHWFPSIPSGTYTGQGQGAWAVDGNADYVVMGGEFPRAGGLQQQGLVRFSKDPATTIAPSETPAGLTPTVRSTGAGEVLVSWRSSWDRDNANLTYEVVRNDDFATPVATRTVSSAEWDRRYQAVLDTGVPGPTATYRVVVREPNGNQIRSNPVSVAVASSGAADGYARSVVADGPQHYWRFSEPSGSTVADYIGRDNGTLTGTPVRGVAGAIPGDAATQFDGTSSQTMHNAAAAAAPFWYTVEAWFSTTTTRGGKIVSYGTSQTGTSNGNQTDHALYMDDSGRINLGTRQGSNQVVTSAGGLNDGQWHHAVGVVTNSGTSLYVDGVQVAARADLRTGMAREGWWRVGGDNLSGWPNDPTSDYFAGSIDEVAVYHHGLGAQRIADHYAAAGGVAANQPPTATFTTQQDGLVVDTDARGSLDPDGSIASYDWSWGDGQPNGSGEVASHTYATPGTFEVTLTVTDDEGATASTSQVVTVGQAAQPWASDRFGRRSSGTWGTADLGGPWTTTGPSRRFSVAGGQGRITLTAPGQGSAAYLEGLSGADVSGRVDVSTDKAVTGGGTSFAVAARHSDASDYRVNLKLMASGGVRVFLTRRVDGATTRLGAAYTVPGLTYAVGDRLRLQFAVSGTPTASLEATVWKVGTTRPGSPQVVRTDSTPALASAGSLGLQGLFAGKAARTPYQVRFDNLRVTSSD